MTQYLFLFTIGPVQSFIAQARKTQDLYAGSKLLSDLIEDTINDLRTIESSAEIIFPNTILKSKPNRFIAILTDPKKNGVLLEEYTRKNYLEKAKAIKNNFSRIDSEKLDSHLKNFLEIYWNAIPLENNTYTMEDYSKLERELGEVKCSRKFFQLNQDGEANR
ncbi:MAG TPA: type III-B CRISPR-associated protein Cas10/Cmr2, partial [Leptospiraceae bacterium]|nr:type III-B CRISPR-associated protein Cas10/Cmr2 [Leptospiraceae bacterium]